MSRELARLVTAPLLDGGLVAVLIEAFIDESVPKPGTSPYTCVGGYLFKKKQAEEFGVGWSNYLKNRGLEFYRTSDCLNGYGPFKGWNVTERDKVARSLITRVKAKSLFGFSVAIDDAAHREVFDKYNEIPTPYGLACFACLIMVRNWADRENYTGDIAYWFEAGHADDGIADRFIKKTLENDDYKKFYRYVAHGFVEKKKAVQLQAGDLIAYHHSKSFVNELAGRPERKDFQALVRPQDMQTIWDHKHILLAEAALLNAGQLTLKS